MYLKNWIHLADLLNGIKMPQIWAAVPAGCPAYKGCLLKSTDEMGERFIHYKCWNFLIWASSFSILIAIPEFPVQNQHTSVQFSCSLMSDSMTPCTAACQASLSIINSWSLLKFMSVKSVVPSNHLILFRPHLLLPSIFPIIRVFSSAPVLDIRWPKYWSFSFNNSLSNKESGLISFRIDLFELLAVPRTPSIFSKTTVQKHQFFGVQLPLWSNSHIHTWLLEKP